MEWAPVSQRIWDMKYRFKSAPGSSTAATQDSDLDATWRRVARALAAPERDPELWAGRFHEALTGFKFLPVAYDSRFEDYYLPASLEASEYPALIKAGERVPTIAVQTALVTYNWPTGSNRYQRVARFTDTLFSRIDRLQVAGFDPKWKTINLGASVPGLARFGPAQEWLDQRTPKTAQKQ